MTNTNTPGEKPSPVQQPHILSVRTHDGQNPSIRCSNISKWIGNQKKHILKLGEGVFLFDSLEAANDAVRARMKDLEATDEFLIFPVAECFGSFSLETQTLLRSHLIRSIHVPLLKCGKENE